MHGRASPNTAQNQTTTTVGALLSAYLVRIFIPHNASARTGNVSIFAGATNTPGAGNYQNGGGPNEGVEITYTGLTIKGGSGSPEARRRDVPVARLIRDVLDVLREQPSLVAAILDDG
jgi:hypothetical protein